MKSPGAPHVVIVGAGFGGLEAARRLACAPVRITVVDHSNHHLFQPLLYQVATAGLNPGDIAIPIRAVLRRQANATVLLARVTRVEREHRRVLLDSGASLDYDYLILACGATHSYFGHDEWVRRAPGLKCLNDAIEVRHRVLWAFEAAEQEPDPERRPPWQTFVVVGGGPTGVELAGALAELARHTLRHDFRRVDPRGSRVILVEAGPTLLASFPASLREDALRRLERLGVEVRLSAQVRDIRDEGVLAGQEWIASRTVLWAAGVAASPVGRTLGLPLDRAGRVRVESDLSLPGSPEVFAVGDMAAVFQGDRPVPGVAPAAIQGGRHAARNIRLLLAGRGTRRFEYRDKGSLATIGRAAAVAQLGRLELRGWVAWLAWLFVHLLFLVGFRNRAAVLLQWVWAYLTFQRGARLITVQVPSLREGQMLSMPRERADVPEPAPVDLQARAG